MPDWTPPEGLIGGAEPRAIVLAAYDPRWPQRFADRAAAIQAALGATALQVEHIGSTAVPGLAAKPIIDILLVVADPGDEAGYVPALEALGYQVRVREPRFDQHRMLRTPDRTVHVHLFPPHSREIDRYLRFRDRLRSDEQDRRLYEATKRRLAAQEWPDMNAYAEAKGEVVEAIMARARR